MNYQKKSNTSAVVLFTNSPQEDALLKCTSGKAEELNALIDFFDNSLQKNIQLIKSYNFDSFLSADKNLLRQSSNTQFILQRGSSFSQKFYNCLNSIFNFGYKKVLIIGNDTLQINQPNILYSLKNTKEGKAVVGPSRDGGFYLLSISKNDFCKIKSDDFDSIRFQTEHTLDGLLNVLTQKLISVHLLPKRDDFDSFNSIVNYFESLKQIQSIYSALCLLCFINLNYKFNISQYISTLGISYLISYLKAPPLPVR